MTYPWTSATCTAGLLALIIVAGCKTAPQPTPIAPAPTNPRALVPPAQAHAQQEEQYLLASAKLDAYRAAQHNDAQAATTALDQAIAALALAGDYKDATLELARAHTARERLNGRPAVLARCEAEPAYARLLKNDPDDEDVLALLKVLASQLIWRHVEPAFWEAVDLRHLKPFVEDLLELHETGGLPPAVATVYAARSAEVVLRIAQDEEDRRRAAGTEFSLFDEKVYDVPVETSIAQVLIIDAELHEEEIEALLQKQFEQLKARTGFKHREHSNQIWIYAYTSKERAAAGLGEWKATLHWNAVADPGAKPVIRFK